MLKRTAIWKNTLGPELDDGFQTERDKLRIALLSLRDNVHFLVGRIAVALPELTQHDITHLDTLWEIASLIIGEDFELTPLEGFVLGSAFYIHDAALCYEAYKNGKDGLRDTIQWKDAYAEIRESNYRIHIEDAKHQADFMALRYLHAYQAEKLLNIKWIDFSSGNEFYLLDNQELRNHLGKLIGQIASSHNWDIETVASTFNTQFNAPTGYPREWRINPLKLACILRCADAAHIDSKRAPDFLYVLLKRNGVSFEHWKAQNRLAKVDLDQSDANKETLLFTSTVDFGEADSNAWFVTYDAICLVDKEIKACNAVLEKANEKVFKVKKVKGIESPRSMAAYIRASGWEPGSAQVHVGNIEKIIQNLGGEMLYGTNADNLAIVLRELIQNSRDSIKARNVFDNENIGKILVTLTIDSGSTWLILQDNGIGMSERIMTDSLLDFGTSFWTSSLVQSEFPGLRSSKFKPVGKFGIGFYSVFMIADQVFVSSRNYNASIFDVRQLKFTQGFSIRPILTKGAPEGFKPSISTQIKLRIKPDIVPEGLLIEIKTNVMGMDNFKVPFKDYLAAICAGLDVSVFYKEFEKEEIKIHEDINSHKFDKNEWLTRVSFAEHQLDSRDIKSYIEKNIFRLKPIVEHETMLGLAAINTKIDGNIKQNFLGIKTIGGLSVDVHCRSGDTYIGYIDYKPKSAKRETGEYVASKQVIQSWAQEQLKELLSLDLNPFERYIASSSLCAFKVDPSELALIPVSYTNKLTFFSLDQLAELSKSKHIAFLDSGLGGGHIEMRHKIRELNGYLIISPITNSSFLSLKMDNGIPENNFSILDCLYRAIIHKGYKPVFRRLVNVGINDLGYNIDAIILTSH
jgi:hypothetical protein